MQNFWLKQGCSILQAMDTEMGAATYHVGTIFGVLSNPTYNVQFIQPSKRPHDGRAGEHPNRLFTHHQFQVIMQPIPNNIQELVSQCFAELGLNSDDIDIRYVEDDWQNPSIGAAGLGWEVRGNEMEILQYTYFQQIASRPLKTKAVELAYGLERLALLVQNKTSVYDLMWSDSLSYADIRKQLEIENTKETELNDMKTLSEMFQIHENNYKKYMQNELFMASYIQCMKMSHTFNLMDTLGLGSTRRAEYIAKIRDYTKTAVSSYQTLHFPNY